MLKPISFAALFYCGAAIAQSVVLPPTSRPESPERGQFAVAHKVDLNSQADGTWSTKGDNAIWTLTLQSDDAISMNVGFSTYVMPEGGRLDVQANGKTIQTYTAADNKSHQQLWTVATQGDAITLVATVAAEQKNQLNLSIMQVSGGFAAMRDAFKDAGTCHAPVACSQGDGFRDQIRAVGLMSIQGTRACSGTLMNNTSENRKPYFMSAVHCFWDDNRNFTDLSRTVVIYWNFQRSTCAGPDDASLGVGYAGSTLRAHYEPADMLLIELDDEPPSVENVFYAGWDRRDINPSSGAGIHHPDADDKRISLFTQSTSRADRDLYYRVIWADGTTEPGSSGSGLFNPTGNVVGALSNGAASCSALTQPDFYGRVFAFWGGDGTAAGQLAPWLDPCGTGATVLNGVDPADATPVSCPAQGPVQGAFPVASSSGGSSSGGGGGGSTGWPMAALLALLFGFRFMRRRQQASLR